MLLVRVAETTPAPGLARPLSRNDVEMSVSSSSTAVPDGTDAATLPVTVSVTRRARPGNTALVMAWVNAGTSLAERFPGFLGSGWVRPSVGSESWHMLYRFDGPASLAVWEASEERRRWLATAADLVEDTQRERRTGIEGWFDSPQEASVETAPTAAPPRWKQAVMIWFAFFPLSLAITVLAGLAAPDLAVLPRVLASTLVMTPIMTYAVLPFLTSRLDWWLHGRRAPWRS